MSRWTAESPPTSIRARAGSVAETSTVEEAPHSLPVSSLILGIVPISSGACSFWLGFSSYTGSATTSIFFDGGLVGLERRLRRFLLTSCEYIVGDVGEFTINVGLAYLKGCGGDIDGVRAASTAGVC